MSWKKHFSPISIENKDKSAIAGKDIGPGPARANYNSWLPEVYSGATNRIDRYGQFSQMDNDSEINAALDILAEFCTQKNKENNTPFNVVLKGSATNSEIKIIQEYMQQWTKLEKFDVRMFRIVRNTFKFGDAFFIRDPETFEWFHIDPANVVRIIINESDGKKPEQYVVRDLNINFQHLVTTQINPSNQNPQPVSTAYVTGGALSRGAQSPYPTVSGSRFQLSQNEFAIDAQHIIHISLSEGLDNNYPFGNSLLESVFKVYKQKELLEDAVVIYRVHRAPERRVFYIDVGSMPSHLAMSFVERVKNEIHQRRIPSANGGSASVIDSTYNPLCLSLDTKIPLLDGRTLELANIIHEYNSGKELWAYSCNPETGKIVPGPITWAGVTRKDTEVIKITFSNNEILICTPDHRIPVLDKGFVEAKDLTPNDKLISAAFRINPSTNFRHIFDLEINKWVFVNKFNVIPHEEDNGVKTHHVSSIEFLSDTIDTGTLTIDGPEICHNYHTFAINSGIFVKNSTMEDYFFPQTCLKLDTKIKLLDGRDLELKDIISEYNEGKVNYTYTINQETFELEPGKIVWAGVTRKDAKLVEVELDSGEKVISTPDHRFIMRDGTEVEAQNLKENDSLMPLYLKNGKTSKYQGEHKYLRYVCNSTGKVKWVHTMVCPKKMTDQISEIHHIDLNSLNNNPDNLVEMTKKDHRKLHKEHARINLINRWNNEESREVLISGIRNRFKNLSEDEKLRLHIQGKNWAKKVWDKDPETVQQMKDVIIARNKNIAKSRTVTYTIEMWERVLELYNLGYNSISKLCPVLKTDDVFQMLYMEANKNIVRDKNLPKTLLPTDTTLTKMAQVAGYINWNDFKNSYKYNHKVVSVKYLDYREDTGDITIESKSNSHNFALSIGIFIHNSEGRGSKVETLPGGSAIGEVSDLSYFTNKLLRALRIPSSYLPTGADDSQQQYNDGRVGTAYIQELRFNKYCMRLQSLIQPVFDIEFKRFLYLKGANIDPGLFEIALQEPQNFASYRQAELDNQRISTFTQMAGLPFVSKRFALKRFLGLTAEEIADNERLWREEAGIGRAIANDSNAEMRSAGISGAGIGSDMGAFTEPEQIPPEEGEENMNGEMSAMGGAAGPAAGLSGGTPAPAMGGGMGGLQQ